MISDFLGITVIGVLVSAVMEWISSKYGVGGTKAKLLTVVFSIVVGAVYVGLSHTVWWTTILGILAAASTTYALAFNK